MPNEFVIKNGYISQGNSLVNAILSANTITLLTNPTYNSSNTQILTRNSSTGIIEFITGTTGGVSSDNFVTGGTYSNGVLTLNRQNGSVIITGFTIDTVCNFDTTSTYGLEYKKISTISGLTQGSYIVKSYITSFSGISKYGFWERTLGIVTTGGTPIITETTSDFDNYSSNFVPLQIIYTPTINNNVEIYLSGLTSENLNWSSYYEIVGCGGGSSSTSTNNIQTNDLFSYQFLLMGA